VSRTTAASSKAATGWQSLGSKSILPSAVLAALVLAWTLPAAGQGIALRGVGPVNESMGGAATGCPLDAAGAIHWNPASICGLESSEMAFGVELLLPSSTISSRINANAFGAGNPPVTLSGSDRGESGVAPIPTMAMVSKSDDSPWAFGFGVFGIGGWRVNYAASLTNPILFPQPNGLGRLSASMDIIQLDPTIACALTDHLSVGFAPTMTIATLYGSPLFLGPANIGGYPEGEGVRYTFGGGFQAGIYYTTDSCWHFGSSIKSPQWMEPFRFQTQDSFGRPEVVKFDVNYPMILSTGASYTGFENWVLASDFRYFNHSGTTGLNSGGFAANGALNGLDWQDIFSVAVGAQHRVSDRLFVRFGYCYNDNPITSEAVIFNVASPLITQQTAHVGMSYIFADNWMFSLAYTHAFENSVTGPIEKAGTGPLAGTSVTSVVSADALICGFSKRF
jgi:long-chain fatty acid transport protein